MMLYLGGDVIAGISQLRLSNRETTVTRLPMKLRDTFFLTLNPNRGRSLDLLNKIGDLDVAG